MNTPTSLNITAAHIAALQNLFPIVATENGGVDFEKLRALLGEYVDTQNERYGLQWPGKADLLRIINEPTHNTLRPSVEASTHWETTQNVFVEGDNLEVLKLMQKAYHGKIKMIYIDPPYNTGKDFVYNDDFRQSKSDQEIAEGLRDTEGNKRVDGLMLNSRERGHYHTNWLNMMYPRLFLARNLLQDDGIVFISIDDNEVDNLKKIMNEIFGEENAITPIIWNLPRGINAGFVARAHEYILAYAKDIKQLKPFKQLTTDSKDSIERCNKKIDSRHPASELLIPAGIRFEGTNATFSGEIGGSEKITLKDPLVFENGKLSKPAVLIAGWTMKNKFLKWCNGEEVYDSKGQKIEEFFFKNNGRLYSRKRLDVVSLKSVQNLGDSQIAREELEKLFGTQDLFSYPKPTQIVRTLAKLTTGQNDIILDFFSGSGTTADAVMRLNAQDGVTRQWICIQLPEETDKNSEAYKAGYVNIADIATERIRRAGAKIQQEYAEMDEKNSPSPVPDVGFKVFTLQHSNFKIFDTTDSRNVLALLETAVDNIYASARPEDILYELLLKSGYSLTSIIEPRDIGQTTVYSINNGELVICLGKIADEDLIRTLAMSDAEQVIMLDQAFQGNDQLKANAIQLFKTHSRDKTRFRTV